MVDTTIHLKKNGKIVKLDAHPLSNGRVIAFIGDQNERTAPVLTFRNYHDAFAWARSYLGE